MIYVGAQKNMGPAGIAVVIVRDDLMGQALPITPSIFDYKIQAENGSMLNLSIAIFFHNFWRR